MLAFDTCLWGEHKAQLTAWHHFYFWWPMLTQDVQDLGSAPSRTSCQLPASLLKPLGGRLHNRSPNSHGYTTILIIVDQFSKTFKLLHLRDYPHPWKPHKHCSTMYLGTMGSLNLSYQFEEPSSL
ncbi:receptor-type tyrosine-protein phosphatase gamma-like [Tachysurus ichikawai]